MTACKALLHVGRARQLADQEAHEGTRRQAAEPGTRHGNPARQKCEGWHAQVIPPMQTPCALLLTPCGRTAGRIPTHRETGDAPFLWQGVDFVCELCDNAKRAAATTAGGPKKVRVVGCTEGRSVRQDRWVDV